MIRSAKKTILDPPTPSVNASTLALTEDGLLMAWFGGTDEGNPDVDIYLTRRKEGVFSEPYAVASQATLPHWNPVLFAEGRQVNLFYKVGVHIPSWYTRRMRSEDGGCSWTTPDELVPGDAGGRGPVRNKPIRLASGRILAPASVETSTCWDAFVDISDDDGRSFRKSAFVPLWRQGEPKPECEKEPFLFTNRGVIQPTLWQTPDGAVHMLLRSTEGWILRSDSFDQGESWCPAYNSGMPNNNSGIDLVQLADRRICLVMNPVGNNLPGRNKGLRTPISLYVSQDEGETFQPLMHLEVNAGEYSYPAIIARENTLYISYTWKREKIAFWEITLE